MRWGTKVPSNGPGLMTKMAAMLMCDKTSKKIFLFRTSRSITLKHGIQHNGLEPFMISSNVNPGLTLT